MADIKVGEVAILKTTEEPTFCLSIDAENAGKGYLSGVLVTVRRPQQTDQGIVHTLEQFNIEELESMEDKKNRVMNDYLGFEAAQNAQKGKVSSLREVDGNTLDN